jgi:pSer/pThr/pTyr-binding forkhead associated (FHA) protein
VSELPPALRYASPVELSERLQAERRGRPFLLFRDGDGRQRIVDLDASGRELSIGRDASNEVALEWDTEVSRAHALLERVGGAWTLVDDGLSRNGSFVDGQRVHGRRRLEPGDVIRLGRTVLVFAAAGTGDVTGSAAAETRPQQPPPELSPAQRRVLAALCRPVAESPFAAPASNREIADELFVSVDTVKSHLHALFELFGVGDVPQNRKRAELVRLAFERGVHIG